MYNQIVIADVKQSKFARDLLNDNTKASPAELNEFKNEIVNGRYLSEAEIHTAIQQRGNFGDFGEILTYYRNWKKGADEAGTPIHMKDPYFKSMVTEIPKMVFSGDSGDFAFGSPTQNQLRAEAKIFIENEINEFYNATLDETGKAPTFAAKQQFETGLRNYVKQNFVEGIQLDALDYENRYDRAKREAAEKKKAESAKLLKDQKDKELADKRKELNIEPIVKEYEPALQLDKLREGLVQTGEQLQNQYITIQTDKDGNEKITFNESPEINEHLIAVLANSPLVEFIKPNFLQMTLVFP